MKIKLLSALLISCALVMALAVYSPLRAGSGSEEVLSALEKTFDMIPEDGYIISAETLYNRMKAGKQDFVIIDNSSHIEDYEAGHIPGALYIPWREIVKEDSLKKLPKDKDIILYDSTGYLENQALIALRVLGYKAFALRWGMMSWTKTRSSAKMIDAIQQGERSAYPVATGADAKLKEERHKKALEHTGC